MRPSSFGTELGELDALTSNTARRSSRIAEEPKARLVELGDARFVPPYNALWEAIDADIVKPPLPMELDLANSTLTPAEPLVALVASAMNSKPDWWNSAMPEPYSDFTMSLSTLCRKR